MSNPMERALHEALLGMDTGDGGPFGAVIVQGDRIIASAHNMVLSSHDPTAHAEITAIRKASSVLGTHDLSGCVLYTSCYPCPMCMGAIFWARIDRVYFASSMDDAAEGGFDDRIFYEIICQPEKSIQLLPMDGEKGKMVFKRWREKGDKKLY